MKQSEDTLTRELPVTRRGRKPLGDRPMTAAERQLKRRTADVLLVVSAASSLLDAMALVQESGLADDAKERILVELRQVLADLQLVARKPAVPGQEPQAGGAAPGQAGEAGL